MEPVFEEVKKDYEGKVEFKKIDVEEDIETSSQYGVLAIPTFVILKEGKEIDRKQGAMSKETLVGWLNSHLA